MDINSILSAVSSVGFPIVCTFVLFWYINKSEERHKIEIDRLSEVVNKNTVAVMKLCERLDLDYDGFDRRDSVRSRNTPNDDDGK